MRDKIKRIKEILTDELCGVYCYNCDFSDMPESVAEEKYGYYGCEDCHRKYIGWTLSEECAEKLTNKITEIIK